jgi:signal transduction histidine kinase
MNPAYENHLQIIGNSQLIKTAIINLIENGCKYSLNHKAVLTLKTEKSGLTIMISDSGIGIPDKDLDHIFQPFYRASNSTSARGHGIGLSLVQKIVQIHKGTIRVKSKLGEGTIFTILFPVL